MVPIIYHSDMFHSYYINKKCVFDGGKNHNFFKGKPLSNSYTISKSELPSMALTAGTF